MTPVFLDTGYVIALETADDQHHEAAATHWRTFAASLPPLVTTSYVFDEIVTFFNCRKRHAKAAEVGNRLMGSPSVQLVHVDKETYLDSDAADDAHPARPMRKGRKNMYNLTKIFRVPRWAKLGSWSLLLIPLCARADNVSYTYDDLNRLIRADYGNGKYIEYSIKVCSGGGKKKPTTACDISDANFMVLK